MRGGRGGSGLLAVARASLGEAGRRDLRARRPPPVRRDADEARFALGRASRAAGRAADQRPLAIVLEDVHWADPSSLGLLAHLARALRGAAGARGAHAPASRTVARCRTRSAGSRLAGFSDLELDGPRRRTRSRSSRRRWAAGRCRRAAARSLQERTRGNPLYVVRARAHAGGRDGGLRSRAACARSSPAARRRCRRTPGTRSSWLPSPARSSRSPVVGRVAGLGRAELLAALEPALRDGLLTQAGARCRFSHAVTREVVYEAQPIARRTERHARMADVLEARLSASPTSPSPRSPTTR